ncbi:MAG: tRNA (adenosine(37)-N6)-threonylcarbamoyltransferase complex dimerization subunit type 1 TsaB [Actinobacteria bacterium]|nr:tRNA (adenosine(37)-N6)-threonylcarbamoyltransferase complex dimerization subunit type 1 TsaB [Actinomycetota bacterium]
MLVLGLDTSSPAVCAVLVRLGDGLEPELLAESVVVDGRRHGELLACGVREVLRGFRPAALAAVVVGTGPGPFTGLRVGLVTAAAMGDALGIPAYGVCSLDALAGQVASGQPVVAVADARRKEVYWASYAAGTRVEGPAVERPGELAARLHSVGGQDLPPVLVGAGAVLHREAFAGLDVLDEPLHPSAFALVRIAAARVRAGAPSEPLTPLYLRRPDAVTPGAAKKVTA